MGKAFQTWSAAEFIHACHSLNLAGVRNTTKDY